MKDLLVYCPDTALLVAEVQANYPKWIAHEDFHNRKFLVDKTPTVRNGNKTLALVRCRDGAPGEPETEAVLLALEEAGVLVVLGTYEECFADPEAKALYDSVHVREPITYTDPESGEEHTHIPAERIGEFA